MSWTGAVLAFMDLIDGGEMKTDSKKASAVSFMKRSAGAMKALHGVAGERAI